MRLLSMSQPDALFTVTGARVYHPMATTFETGALIAIHAAAEPPSWAGLERRAAADKYFGRALLWYGLVSAESLRHLALGAVIGIVRLIEVHDARNFDDPPLCRIGGRKFLWRLEPERAIEPLRGVRARPNLWAPPDVLVRAIEAAPARVPNDEVPSGCGRAVFPRGDARWADETARRQREDRFALDLHAVREQERAQNDPLNWPIGNRATERQLKRGLRQYFATHETRERAGVLEAKVDRRNRTFGDLFADLQWVTRDEFERRVRRHAVQSALQRDRSERGRITAAYAALHAAREEVRKREHEYRMLTDDSYREAMEQAERERRLEERLVHLDLDGDFDPDDPV